MDQNKKEKIAVLIPVFNECESIGKVLDAIPRELTDQIIVVDNGSSDGSREVAEKHGATVIEESVRGYGAACLRGIAYLEAAGAPDILVFLDGDYSDDPNDMHALISKLYAGYDFVLGSRILGIETYAAELSPHSITGNKLAAFFLKWLFDGNYTDLGPFRAIRFKKLLELEMKDKNFGWTIEMQIKAVRKNLQIAEIPVHYRNRYAGVSKVTGTFSGSIKAFFKITILIVLFFFNIKR